MTSHNFDYVPILKCKQAEIKALTALPSEIGSRIAPLIEMLPRQEEQASESESAEIDLEFFPSEPDAFPSQRHYLDRLCQSSQTVMIDVALAFTPEEVEQAVTATDQIVSQFSTSRCRVLPVARLAHQNDPVLLASPHSITNGIAIRVTLPILGHQFGSSLNERLCSYIERLGLRPEQIVFVWDSGHLPEETDAESMLTRFGEFVSCCPVATEAKAVVIAGGSMPENLGHVPMEPGEHCEAERFEWTVLWRQLKSRGILPENGRFGDYGIEWPGSRPNPLTVRGKPSLRYTTDSAWLLYRRELVNSGGFDNMTEICQELTHHPAFSGPQFSPGDQEIDLCARHQRSTANAPYWRQAGFSHHFAKVVEQLSSPSGSSRSLE